MSEEKVLTPKELKAQADAILAAADGKKAAKAPTARKSGKAAKSTAVQQEPPQLMTDEEAKKAGILRLDDKQVAALPLQAGWLVRKCCVSFWHRARKRDVWTPQS